MSENTSWWQRLQPWVRRTIRGGALWLLAGLLAAAWGLSTASHTGSVGPHTAEYSTTLNNEITFDMGPVGALIIDSPLPLNLGVDIEVGHIPDELTIEGRTV